MLHDRKKTIKDTDVVPIDLQEEFQARAIGKENPEAYLLIFTDSAQEESTIVIYTTGWSEYMLNRDNHMPCR